MDNLLLDEDGIVKLCDFGVSHHLKNPTDLISEQVGTPAYMSPEVLQSKAFCGKKADVWSLGVCLFAILFGQVPFRASTLQELSLAIISTPFSFPNDPAEPEVSQEVRHLIKMMLCKDPEKRVSIEEVLRHRWLSDCPKRMAIFSNKEVNKIT